MGHRLWEKVRCQHRPSAPSSSLAITHQSSKKFGAFFVPWRTYILLAQEYVVFVS
jgi:hypothetical protein